MVHQKYLFRQINKDRNKGDYVIVNLNPDIFHTIQFLNSNAEIVGSGGNAANFNAVEKNELDKIQKGESEIPFLKNVDGTPDFLNFRLNNSFNFKMMYNPKKTFLFQKIILSNGKKPNYFS